MKPSAKKKKKNGASGIDYPRVDSWGCCHRSTCHEALGCVGMSVSCQTSIMGQSQLKARLAQTELECPALARGELHEGLLHQIL